MGSSQFFKSKRRRKPAGIANLQAVRKEHDLNAGVVRIVPVNHRVYYSLAHDLFGNFIGCGGPDILRPGSDRAVDLAENEVHCLVDQIKGRALVNLVGRNRLAHLSPMKVCASDFRTDQKPLRRLPEQQNSSICQPPVV